MYHLLINASESLVFPKNSDGNQSYFILQKDFQSESGLFLAWAWLAKPKAIVIIYWNLSPHPRIYGETRGKVRITACKAYRCASKKARGKKIYFQLSMIVSFKFKRNTERYLILIVRNGLSENFEIR